MDRQKTLRKVLRMFTADWLNAEEVHLTGEDALNDVFRLHGWFQ